MKKKISSLRSVETLTNVLEYTSNNIPIEMKRTFSFKGRKSPYVISKALEVLTEPGDVIFDPFLGSGTTILGCQLANRHLIGTELDNFTFAIDKVLFERIDEKELDGALQQVVEQSKDYILSLYETECCG